MGFNMAIKLVDSYDAGSVAVIDNLSATSSVWKGGQSITGKTGKLSSCKFYLKKTGLPTGNAVAELYAHSGTFGTDSKPTGAVLATSDNFDVSTLTTSLALVTFNFSGVNRINLVNGTKYCIICSYGGGDGSKYLSIGGKATGGTHGGNYMEYNITTWAAFSAIDTYFFVYVVTTGGMIAVL